MSSAVCESDRGLLYPLKVIQSEALKPAQQNENYERQHSKQELQSKFKSFKSSYVGYHCSEFVNKREAKSLSQPLASEALHFGYSFLHLLFTCVNVSRVPGTRLFWEEHVFEDGVVSFTATLCTNTKLQIHQVHSLIHQVVNCVPVEMKGSEVTYQRAVILVI